MKIQQPEWQPISLLPVVGGMIEAALVQLGDVRRGAEKPGVPGDAILNRVVELHGDQLRVPWLFEEQFTRWKREPLTYALANGIDRLVTQSSKPKRTKENSQNRSTPRRVDHRQYYDDARG